MVIKVGMGEGPLHSGQGEMAYFGGESHWYELIKPSVILTQFVMLVAYIAE